MIKFTVYGEPVPKARARVFFNKHVGRVMAYTPKKTMSWENLVASTASQYCPKSGVITGPVKVTLRIYRNIPKSFSKTKTEMADSGELLPITKPDIDNILKSVCDALNGVIWHDDSQVVELGDCIKRYSKTPRIEVEIFKKGKSKAVKIELEAK